MWTIGNGNRCAKINRAVSVPQGCSARSVSAVFLVVSQTLKKLRQVCVKQHREYRHVYIESILELIHEKKHLCKLRWQQQHNAMIYKDL